MNLARKGLFLNDKIETSPSSLFAGERDSLDYFKADEGTDKAPSVSGELSG